MSGGSGRSRSSGGAKSDRHGFQVVESPEHNANVQPIANGIPALHENVSVLQQAPAEPASSGNGDAGEAQTYASLSAPADSIKSLLGDLALGTNITPPDSVEVAVTPDLDETPEYPEILY